MRRRSSCTGEALCTEISRCVREHVPVRIAVGAKPEVHQRRATNPSCIFVMLVFFPANLLNFVRRPELQVPSCNRLGVVASSAPNCTDAYVARVATFVVTWGCLSFSGCTEDGTRVL